MTAPTTPPAPLPFLQGAPARPLLWLLVIGVLSILAQGYVVGIINHGLQIPLMRMWAGETAFDADPFMTTMKETYTTVFYPAVGWLSRFVPLQALLLALFLLFRAGTVVLAWRISLALWNDPWTAILTAGAFTFQLLTFGDDVVSDNYLTHGAMAQVMTLGSLLLLVQGRLLLAILVASLLFHVHGMHSIHLLLMLGAAALWKADRKTLLSLGAGVVLSAVVALPTVWWMKEAGVLGAASPPGVVEAVHAWFPTHFWPSSWGVYDWPLLAFPVLAAWPLWKLAGPDASNGVLARVALASLIFGVLGGLAMEVAPSLFLMRLHPMRLSWIMALAGLPYLVKAAVELARSLGSSAQDEDARLRAALGCTLLLGFSMGVLYRSAFWLTFVPALWLAARPRRPGAQVLAVLTLVLAVAIPLLTIRGNDVEFQGTGEAASRLRKLLMEQGAVGLLAAVSVMVAYFRRAQGPHVAGSRSTLVGSLLVVSVLHLCARGVSMVQTQRTGPIARWEEVQRWCAANLPAGEVMLVPLTQLGLRTFSKQVPAVDFQEGDALFHHPASLETFIPKLRLYGWKPGEIIGFSHQSRLDPLDVSLTEDDARRLGHEMGAHLAIRRTRHPAWKLPELFRNADFVIYELGQNVPD